MNEKLMPCGDCGQQISKRAVTCPGCGAPNEVGLAHREIEAHEQRKREEAFHQCEDKVEKWSDDSVKSTWGFIWATLVGGILIWASYDFKQWELAVVFLGASAILGFIGIRAKLKQQAALSNLAGLTCGLLWGYMTWQILVHFGWPKWCQWTFSIVMVAAALGAIGGQYPPKLGKT